MARAVASGLGYSSSGEESTVRFVTYPEGPQRLTEGMKKDEWDIGLIANEPKRAKTIWFSPPYCEIRASLMVKRSERTGCDVVRRIGDADQKGLFIVSKKGSAYTLWLQENIKRATVVTEPSVNDAIRRFLEDENVHMWACLRPKLSEVLMTQTKKKESTTKMYIMNEDYTSIKQSVGCSPSRTDDEKARLCDAVLRLVRNGFVERTLKKHGVFGPLSLPDVRE